MLAPNPASVRLVQVTTPASWASVMDWPGVSNTLLVFDADFTGAVLNWTTPGANWRGNFAAEPWASGPSRRFEASYVNPLVSATYPIEQYVNGSVVKVTQPGNGLRDTLSVAVVADTTDDLTTSRFQYNVFPAQDVREIWTSNLTRIRADVANLDGNNEWRLLQEYREVENSGPYLRTELKITTPATGPVTRKWKLETSWLNNGPLTFQPVAGGSLVSDTPIPVDQWIILETHYLHAVSGGAYEAWYRIVDPVTAIPGARVLIGALTNIQTTSQERGIRFYNPIKTYLTKTGLAATQDYGHLRVWYA